MEASSDKIMLELISISRIFFRLSSETLKNLKSKFLNAKYNYDNPKPTEFLDKFPGYDAKKINIVFAGESGKGKSRTLKTVTGKFYENDRNLKLSFLFFLSF